MSTDFLIHRDSEGQIVRAVPYVNIMEMQYVETKASYGTSEHQEIINVYYHVYYILQNGKDRDFAVDTQADAERYLAEWREWWEEHDKYYSAVTGRVRPDKCRRCTHYNNCSLTYGQCRYKYFKEADNAH